MISPPYIYMVCWQINHGRGVNDPGPLTFPGTLIVVKKALAEFEKAAFFATCDHDTTFVADLEHADRTTFPNDSTANQFLLVT